MSEHVTQEQCLERAMDATVAGRSDEAAAWHRAAATIEALQARIEAVDAVDYSEVSAQVMERQLAVKPPASVDTTELRRFAGEMRDQRPVPYNNALATCACRVADALDASRAELAAMSRFQCKQPDVVVCERRWQADHQLASLQHVDGLASSNLADEYGYWGCDIIEHVAEDLVAIRAECERLRAVLLAAGEWISDHSDYSTDDGYRCIDCDSLTATERCDVDCACNLLTTWIDAELGAGQ